jgi:hypothetical protein
MLNNITQYLQGLTAGRDREALRLPMQALGGALSTQPLKTAGLVIKAGGGVLAKIGAAAYYGTVKGRLVTVAASTDMPALTGLTITTSNFNVACFFIDAASAVTVLFGTEATAIGGVKFPQFPVDKALVGFLLITHSDTFTGNTTALDTATTVYFSPTGAFDPTCLFN